MARKQKLIHLHGTARYEKKEGQVVIDKGEIVVTHANDAVDTELAVLSNTEAVVYFPSLAKVEAMRDVLSGRIDALVTGDTSVGKQIETALKTAKTYADGLNEAMDDRVKALEGDGENTGVLAEAKGYTDTEIGKVNTEVAKKADQEAMTAALALKANAADVYTKGEVDAELAKKANAADVYTQTQVNEALALKANAADVYAKTETYTKGEVNEALALKANAADMTDALALKADKETTYTKTEVDNLLSPKADAADVNAHVNNGDIHVTAQQKTDWQAATAAINAFIASADHQGEAVDTLKEIQDFLTSDDGTVQALLKDVATNKQAIVDEKTARETADNGFETRIATLEGKFTGDDSVAKQIEEAVAAEAALRIAEDAKKADKETTYTKTEVDNLLSPKATTEYVNEQLELKANAADVYTKGEVDAELAKKADQEAMTAELAKKANAADVYTQTQVNEALALKADKETTYTKTEVDGFVNGLDGKIALKANAADVYTQTQVNEALALKADKETTYTKTEVDNALNLKANDNAVLKTVTVTEGNNITVTPATNTVNLDFSAMIIDCGTY